MQVIEINDKEQWDGFVGSQPTAQFAQSWDWADFQQAGIGQVWRLAVEDQGRLLAAAKFVKKKLLAGRSYLYCDRGPIFAGNRCDKEVASLLFARIREIAYQEQAVFFRFDPVFNLDGAGLSAVKTIDIQPKKTALLDLAKSEADLLASMHQKTRYNIRLARKKGVTIEQADIARFEEFWRLMEETGERDQFSLHRKRYYRAMVGLGMVKLYFAHFDGAAIAASIIARYGDTATYVHGGSGNRHREVMAPFLLQWTAILESKQAGLRYYDFYGVDETKWPGVTRFKMGFAPAVIEYAGTHDLVIDNMWYSVYKALRKIRRKF